MIVIQTRRGLATGWNLVTKGSYGCPFPNKTTILTADEFFYPTDRCGFFPQLPRGAQKLVVLGEAARLAKSAVHQYDPLLLENNRQGRDSAIYHAEFRSL